MIEHLTGGLLAYYTGLAIVALPGLIGVILMGRMHRAAIQDCRRLREEVSRAEEATGRVRCLLSDLVATMNLSLALCSTAAAGRNCQQEIDQLRAAVEDAVQGQDPLLAEPPTRHLAGPLAQPGS